MEFPSDSNNYLFSLCTLSSSLSGYTIWMVPLLLFAALSYVQARIEARAFIYMEFAVFAGVGNLAGTAQENATNVRNSLERIWNFIFSSRRLFISHLPSFSRIVLAFNLQSVFLLYRGIGISDIFYANLILMVYLFAIRINKVSNHWKRIEFYHWR